MTDSFDIRIDSGDRCLVDVHAFQLKRKAVTFLFGESGIGKTMISKAYYGLLDPAVLTVTINRQDYDSYVKSCDTKTIQKSGFFVFQEPSSHLHPLLKVSDQIREGTLALADNEQDIAKHLWGTTEPSGLHSLLDIYPKPYRPSGGEKQRILLLMAFKKIHLFLNQKSETDAVFIFDEPTGSLDNGYRNRFLDYLFELFRIKSFTALIITHDYSMISEVYRRHQDILPDMDFKELILENEKQVLRPFVPGTYLNWLSEQKKAESLTENRRTVLQVESGAKIFGRRLSFHRTESENAEVPLSVQSGAWTYLKAPSGVGKTTVAKIITGLLRADRLQLLVDAALANEETPLNVWKDQWWGKAMTMVFQHADESLNLQATVADVFRGLPVPGMDDDENLMRHLTTVFDDELAKGFLLRKVAHLSGGQKQRLNLLRGMILDTKILILDEPLNGLDFDSVTKILYKLRAISKKGTGIIIISHNEEIFDHLIPDENIFYLRADVGAFNPR